MYDELVEFIRANNNLILTSEYVQGVNTLYALLSDGDGSADWAILGLTTNSNDEIEFWGTYEYWEFDREMLEDELNQYYDKIVLYRNLSNSTIVSVMNIIDGIEGYVK